MPAAPAAARPPTRCCRRCSSRTSGKGDNQYVSHADGRPPHRRIAPAHGRRRHRHHASGHHRPAPLRGQDRAHGAARRAHRSAQPRAAERAARARPGARAARRSGGGPPARSRPLQDRERHPRPSHRRQAPEDGDAAPAHPRQGDGHDRAHGRGRVRGPAGRHRAAGGCHRAGAAHHRDRERALRSRRHPGRDRHQRRHRHRPGGRARAPTS